MTQARGSNLHHMRGYVEEKFGREAWSSVTGSMGAADQEILRGMVTVGWYPLGLQYRLLQAIDDFLGCGDGALVGAVGEYEATQDLTAVHRLFLRMANPGFVLEQSGRYWSRFYTSGRWEVQRDASTSATAWLRDLDPFDPLMADYLQAYIRQMWALMRVDVVTIESKARAGVIRLRGAWR